ncbi:MAG: hypothetical protein KJZ93_05090 [Caldilineaceae bacterium]|nr:hypothetical protein [Caldilineaceae bacterium]
MNHADLLNNANTGDEQARLIALATALDSTPVITWLAQQRQLGVLDRATMRRGVMMRMIWQVAYHTGASLVANIDYLLGRSVWGSDVRATLATDICALRLALAAAGHRLAYSNGPRKGYYVCGRPELDPQLVRGIQGAVAEVDPAQMAIVGRHSAAERLEQTASMIEFVQRTGALRLRQRRPHLSEAEALYRVRQGKTT